MKQGHRPGTRKNIRSQAKSYQHFCEKHELQELPADEWQLVRYATHTAEHVTTAKTVNNYVSGVRTIQKLAGYNVPSNYSPNLKLVLNGIKTYLAKPVNQATPMTLPIMVEVWEVVDFHNEFESCVYACMLTGFYLLLRSSNMVPSSTSKFNPNEQLTRWHVGLEKDLAIFIIEWSKNNQNYKRELTVPVRPAKDPRVCLITVLTNYFKQVPAEDEQPCFCFHNEDGHLKALTYDQLNETMKTLVSRTGRDGTIYTTHALRRGGTNFAIRANLCPEFVQVLGDWGSQCFLTYIDFALDLRLEAANKMAKYGDKLTTDAAEGAK